MQSVASALWRYPPTTVQSQLIKPRTAGARKRATHSRSRESKLETIEKSEKSEKEDKAQTDVVSKVEQQSRGALRFIPLTERKTWEEWIWFWYDGYNAKQVMDSGLLVLYARTWGAVVWAKLHKRTLIEPELTNAWYTLDPDVRQRFQNEAKRLNDELSQPIPLQRLLDAIDTYVRDPLLPPLPTSEWDDKLPSDILSEAVLDATENRGIWLLKTGVRWEATDIPLSISQWDVWLYGESPVILEPAIDTMQKISFRSYELLWNNARRVKLLPRVVDVVATGSPYFTNGYWLFRVTPFDRLLVLLPRDTLLLDDWNRLFFTQPAATLAQRTPALYSLNDYYKWLDSQEPSLQDWWQAWALNVSNSTLQRRVYNVKSRICDFILFAILDRMNEWRHVQSVQLRSEQCLDRHLSLSSPVLFTNAGLSPLQQLPRLGSTTIVDMDTWHALRSQYVESRKLEAPIHQRRPMHYFLSLVTNRIGRAEVSTVFPISISLVREPWWPQLYEWWFRYSGDLRMIDGVDQLLSILWPWAPSTVTTWSQWIERLPPLLQRPNVLQSIYRFLIDSDGRKSDDRQTPGRHDWDRQWAIYVVSERAWLSSIVLHLDQEYRAALQYMQNLSADQLKENAYTAFVPGLLRAPHGTLSQPSPLVLEKTRQLTSAADIKQPVSLLDVKDVKDLKDVKDVKDLNNVKEGGTAKRSLGFGKEPEEKEARNVKRPRGQLMEPILSKIGETPEVIVRERQTIMDDSKGALRFVPVNELKTWSEWTTFWVFEPVATPLPILKMADEKTPIIGATDPLSLAQFLRFGGNRLPLLAVNYRIVDCRQALSSERMGLSFEAVERDSVDCASSTSGPLDVVYTRGWWLKRTLDSFLSPTDVLGFSRWYAFLYGAAPTMQLPDTVGTLTDYLEFEPKMQTTWPLNDVRPRTMQLVPTGLEPGLDLHAYVTELKRRGYWHIPPVGTWAIPIPVDKQVLVIWNDAKYDIQDWDKLFFGISVATIAEISVQLKTRLTIHQYLTQLDARRPSLRQRPLQWVIDPLRSSDTQTVLRRPTVVFAAQACLNAQDFITQEDWPSDLTSSTRLVTIYVPVNGDWSQFPSQGNCFHLDELVKSLETSVEPTYNWLLPENEVDPVTERYYKLFYPNVLLDQASYQILVAAQSHASFRYFLLIPVKTAVVGTQGGFQGVYGSFHGRTETIYSLVILPTQWIREPWWPSVYRWWWTFTGDMRIFDSAKALLQTFQHPTQAALDMVMIRKHRLPSSIHLDTRQVLTRLVLDAKQPTLAFDVLGVSNCTILVDIGYALDLDSQPWLNSSRNDTTSLDGLAQYVTTVERFLVDISRLADQRLSTIRYASRIVQSRADRLDRENVYFQDYFSSQVEQRRRAQGLTRGGARHFRRRLECGDHY